MLPSKVLALDLFHECHGFFVIYELRKDPLDLPVAIVVHHHTPFP